MILLLCGERDHFVSAPEFMDAMGRVPTRCRFLEDYLTRVFHIVDIRHRIELFILTTVDQDNFGIPPMFARPQTHWIVERVLCPNLKFLAAFQLEDQG